ncbi:SIMPL domain-containing protein, partial [Agrococcus sp. HG114]|uniref:SIMPL domain-containing protein n=1 Tax=Agrococcus sp. HG114 TaxID=2969757 RepID=UPI00215B6453
LAARARARAVADAVERAADYARAAGLGKPRIAALREPDLTVPQPLVAKHRASEAVLLGGADSGPALELAAGEIEVVAVVEAAFEADAERAGD